MSEQQSAKIVDTMRFNLYANIEDGVNKSKLLWSVFNGMPRIVVFTGVPNDINKGVIYAGMSYESMMMFLDELELIADYKDEVKRKMEIFLNVKNQDDPNGGTVRVKQCDIYYGKDKSGIVWISLIKEDRPKIKFDFRASPNIVFYENDGSIVGDDKLSVAYTKAAIEFLRKFYDKHTTENRKNGSQAPSNPASSIEIGFSPDLVDISF